MKQKNEDVEKHIVYLCDMVGEVANCEYRDENFHCNCPNDCEAEDEDEDEDEVNCNSCPYKYECDGKRCF